jgi:hypothetical protein
MERDKPDGVHKDETDLGRPIAYLALSEGTPVLDREDRRIGVVDHVVADVDLDLFYGVVVHTHPHPGTCTRLLLGGTTTGAASRPHSRPGCAGLGTGSPAGTDPRSGPRMDHGQFSPARRKACPSARPTRPYPVCRRPRTIAEWITATV